MIMENKYILNPNPLVKFLQKPQREFTKADIIRYVVENEIEMVNLRYVGADGRLKTLNFIINSWLNIHPNCLHSISPWTPAGKSEEELRKIEDFSNPRKNPFTHDPRTEKQIKAYHAKEAARRRWLADYRQWEKYRMTLGDKVPKTFNTFLKHKRAKDTKYLDWETAYKEANDG